MPISTPAEIVNCKGVLAWAMPNKPKGIKQGANHYHPEGAETV